MARPIIVKTLYLLLFCLLLGGAADSCTDQDRDALLALKQSVKTSTSTTSSLNDWAATNGNCCNWEGVSCDESLRIRNISVSGKGLSGSLPPGLANITSLEVLNVSHNQLSGPLPQDLSTLPSLRTLDISVNNFSGELSPLLLGFRSLQLLNLSSNAFNGSLPSSALRNLTLLTRFLASDNHLSGDLPLTLCQTSPLLQEMDLSSNSFSGTISDDLRHCASLQVLDLGDNNLVGNLPQALYNLTSLTTLRLTSNKLDGGLDDAIGKLTSLSHLMLGSNNFTGQLPSNLSACTNLKVFTANANKFNGSMDVVRFDQFLMLENLDLNSNAFVGSIPPSLTECVALKSINFAKNKLSGTIPSSLYRLKNLTTFLLSSNNLNGSISLLDGSEQLVSVILSKNVFNEKLPDRMQGLTNLQVFALGNIRVSGSIPEWLRNCTKLQVLDLSWNNLTGPIPSWIGSFPHLFYLDLSNNSLSGSIPPELFLLPALIHSDTNLTGLQSVVSNLAIKQKVDVPELQYTQVSAFPPSIYLSHNRLQGSIPSQVGAFVLLLDMDLSFNNLSGNIPETIASMTDLESLDLSHNSLTGRIPSSLTKLTFLAYFNVSYNQLEGQIPLGNQFSTFSNKSYEGNPGLCGPPLSSPCGNGNVPTSDANSSKKRKNLILRVAIIVPICTIGFVALLVGLFTWKLNRRNVVYQGSDSFHGSESPQSLTEALNSTVVMFHMIHAKLTMADLFKATNNFDSANIVGCGGFGLVYRADLDDGSKLAIKKLTGDCGQMEREFQAEVETLSKAQHENLVPLQGYVQFGNDKLLLYSYMENGSLDYWLHEKVDGGTCLDWPTRLKIARGSAHGLAYLHQVCNPHIVHRDIKSSNILLDEKFRAHLADFGLARLMMGTDTHVTTEVVGTLGYIPPEYSHAINATLKGDVYSFGVVLLELLTGRRPVDVCKGRGAGDLVSWVINLRSMGRSKEVFDTVLLAQSEEYEGQMIQVLDAACPCLNTEPSKRPTISKVVSLLDKIGQEQISK